MKKQIYLIPLALASMALVACNGGGGKKPQPETYNVKIEGSEVLELKSEKPVQGTDFKAQIVVKAEYEEYCHLPDFLAKVQVGDVELSEVSGEYSYTIEDEIGKLEIAGAFINGDVVITTQALTDQVSVKSMSKSTDLLNRCDLNNKVATINESYTGDLFVKKEYADQYVLPEDSSDISILMIENKETLDKKTWHVITNGDYPVTFDVKSETLLTITIPEKVMVYEDGKDPTDAILSPIFADIFVAVNTELKTYEVTNNDTEATELEFKSSEGGAFEDVAHKGQDYSFKIAVAEASTLTYNAPTSVIVTVDGEATSNYEIKRSDDKKTTDVKIYKEAITGPIHIEAHGLAIDKVTLNVKTVKAVDDKLEIQEIPTSSDCVVTYSIETEELGIPTVDNVRIFIGKPEDMQVEEWIIPNEEGGKYENDITFDETTHALTINKTVVAQAATDNNEIYVVACAPAASLMKELEWSEISKLSKAGYAKYLFVPGETKELDLNFNNTTQPHSVRVLDFNRDVLSSGARIPAGMTLEFVECIDLKLFNKDRTINTYYYEGSSGSTYQSDLYKYLNEELYPVVEAAFAGNGDNVIVNVSKNTMEGTKGSQFTSITKSPNYLFPLSMHEINGFDKNVVSPYMYENPAFVHEGEQFNGPYQYYKCENPKERRVKINNKGETSHYWLRSPYYETESLNEVNIILKEGKRICAYTDLVTAAVAPAFCI